MGDQPTLRHAESDDAPRIRELVESSITSSYALSPQDIETILDAEFDQEAIRDRIDGSDTIVLVAEVDGVVAGVAEASPDDDEHIRWLHVDPERRGAGAGTALFERICSELEDQGVESPRAVTMAANTSSGTFFERLGLEQEGERTVDIGGRDTVQYVYAENVDDSTDEEADSAAEDEDEPPDYPDSVTVDDGTDVFLGDDPFRGTEGWFASTFSDEERSEEYGFYCLNCDSADVSMNDMERVRCANCGNTHKPGENYDGAYL